MADSKSDTSLDQHESEDEKIEIQGELDNISGIKQEPDHIDDCITTENDKDNAISKMSAAEIDRILQEIESTELMSAQDLIEQEELEQEAQSRLLDCQNRKLEADKKREQLSKKREMLTSKWEYVDFVKRAQAKYYRAKITDQAKLAAKLQNENKEINKDG